MTLKQSKNNRCAVACRHGTLNTKVLFPLPRVHYHRMISELVGQVVMDRRSGASAESFSSNFGISVSTMIQKFSDLDRLQSLEEESASFREKYMKIAAEMRELEHELSKLRSRPFGMPGNEDQTQSKPGVCIIVITWIASSKIVTFRIIFS